MPRRTILIENRSEARHAAAQEFLPAIAGVLDEQLHHVARAYSDYVWNVAEAVRQTGWRVAVLDSADQANALGYHDVDPDGHPYARVFLDPIFDNEGTWLEGPLSVCAVCSHEVCEMVLDPGANRWADDWQGHTYAYELCDAVESDVYDLLGFSVSNFVLPAWFEPMSGGPYDWLQLCTRPFEVRPGGYAITQRSADVELVYGEHSPFSTDALRVLSDTKSVPGARSYARQQAMRARSDDDGTQRREQASDGAQPKRAQQGRRG